MKPAEALRLVLVWALVMILILLTDVAISAPAASHALSTAPATNTPRAVSQANSTGCLHCWYQQINSKGAAKVQPTASPADHSYLDKYTVRTHMERDRHYLILPVDYHLMLILTDLPNEDRIHVEHKRRLR
jgi:hypothetical protein